MKNILTYFSPIYSGLSDEPGSHCFGAIRDGVFDGQIHTASDGIYYIGKLFCNILLKYFGTFPIKDVLFLV